MRRLMSDIRTALGFHPSKCAEGLDFGFDVLHDMLLLPLAENECAGTSARELHTLKMTIS